MKKKLPLILCMMLLVVAGASAERISGYIGFSTGYEFNMIRSEIYRGDIRPAESEQMNFQGIPVYIEGETYFSRWVGGYYGVSIMTFPTVLSVEDESYKPFAENAPTLYSSPYLGLALRYDFNDMLAMIFDTGLSYTAWKLPSVETDAAAPADHIHMLNVKCDLALGIHPKHNMSIRVGMKLDTPVYTGFQHSSDSSGIRVGNTYAKAYGVKLYRTSVWVMRTAGELLYTKYTDVFPPTGYNDIERYRK